MPALPETIYNPDEKYQHPEPGTTPGVPVESVPPIPAPAEPKEPTKENTKVNIQVPTSLVRWFCYTIMFSFLLLPLFVWDGTLYVLKLCSAAAVLGHFAGQLNKLIDK